MSGRHPIVDHAFAALPFDGAAPAYAEEDLEILEAALADLTDEAERVDVHLGLVALLSVLHEHGLRDAVGQLLPVLEAHAEAHPELDAPELGYGEDDGLDRRPRPNALFGERIAPKTMSTGGMSLLALRAGR